MNNEKYNGWTNYATWRVNLEIVEQIDPDMDCDFTPESVKEIVEYAVFGEDTKHSLMKDYAEAFLSQVDYVELVYHLNQYIQEYK